MRTFLKLSLSLLLSLSASAFATPGVSVEVTLSPAGRFKIDMKRVKGFAHKTADGIVAENVLVETKSLDTGIELRNKHTKDRLKTTEFPMAKLIKAVGKDGKGKAIIEIKGQKYEANGTYKIEGSEVKAEFKVHLPDLNIKDVRYMGVGVEDDVVVSVSLPLQEKGKAMGAKK